MRYIVRLDIFLRPYRARAFLALVLLASLVSLDLAIPRLIQRIIDQGINGHDQASGHQDVEQGTHQELLARRGFYHHLNESV